MRRWGPPLESIELWSGAALFAWGGWVLWYRVPLIDFAAYEPIARNVPDSAWSWLAIVLGVAQVAARYIERRWARGVSTFMAMLLFKIIAVSNMVSDQPGPSAMVLCAFAFADIAVLIRLTR